MNSGYPKLAPLPQKERGPVTEFLLENPIGQGLFIGGCFFGALVLIPFVIGRVQAIETAHRQLVAARMM